MHAKRFNFFFIFILFKKWTMNIFSETKCWSTYIQCTLNKSNAKLAKKAINTCIYTQQKREQQEKKKAWRKFKMCSQIPNYFCQLLLCLDGMFNRTLSTSKIIYYHLKTACTPGDVRLPSCEKMMATHLPASAKYLLI